MSSASLIDTPRTELICSNERCAVILVTLRGEEGQAIQLGEWHSQLLNLHFSRSLSPGEARRPVISWM